MVYAVESDQVKDLIGMGDRPVFALRLNGVQGPTKKDQPKSSRSGVSSTSRKRDKSSKSRKPRVTAKKKVKTM